MIFDFDSDKIKRNKEKHGIDFVGAQKLWDDSRSIGFPGKSDDEPRFAMLSELKPKLWVAFYTVREERIRIISVRRARKAERKLYES